MSPNPDNSSAAPGTDAPVPPDSLSRSLANNGSFVDLFLLCGLSFESSRGVLSAAVCITVNVVVLSPLCSVVLYRGFQRWRSRSATTTASHSDVIAYHMAVLEALGVLANLTLGAGLLRRLASVLWAAWGLLAVVIPCRLSLHCLACAERYLAAVHPVAYLGLKGTAAGARARNVAAGAAWLSGAGGLGLLMGTAHMPQNVFMWGFGGFYVCCLLTILFCSIAVLSALLRPPPGDGGRERQEAGGGRKAEEGGVSRLRRRAFRIIVAILLALLGNIVGLLVCGPLLRAPGLSDEDMCAMFLSMSWFFLPTSLVVPLMFLHRTGLTPGCMRTE